jgi:REP element-mobilizing transposase RayT
MMGYARKALVSLQDTSHYHCVARCVRRAWLCGVDEYAAKDYSHRKAWVAQRLGQLTAIFAIDICAYAVLSNHYHVVLHVDQTRCASWSLHDIVGRWSQLFRVPPLVERWQQGLAGEAEHKAAEDIIKAWRTRLYDISWFMRCLNEHLARMANAEDDCRGRFWEGRFKSQALLDEAGLLTAMAYVDLNPVRAGIAANPESSEFTSIYQRIMALQTAAPPPTSAAPKFEVPLQPFSTSTEDRTTLPYRFDDYLTLVDWTGRAIRSDKIGFIHEKAPPIMQRLNIDSDAWLVAMRPAGNVFGRAMGRLDRLRLHAQTIGQSWIRGLRQAEQLYAP